MKHGSKMGGVNAGGFRAKDKSRTARRLEQLQLHRLLQLREETLLLFHRDLLDAFGGRAADAAEEMRRPTLKADDMDARIAHMLLAIRASERRGHFRMLRASGATVFQNHRGRARCFAPLKFRDGNDRIRGLYEQFHVAKSKLLPRRKPSICYGLAVNECAIGGIAILKMNAVAGEG